MLFAWSEGQKIPNPISADSRHDGAGALAYNAPSPFPALSDPVPDSTIRLITEDAELDELCRKWRSQPALGLDTEFFRERTYYPIPALAQVADDSGCWLVDPLAIDDLSPLFDLLADERTVKVMHAPSQDIELFRVMGGRQPRAIYDTQTAAILSGLGQGPGYQALVAQLLEVDLPKTETRSDWRRRPLSGAQQHYAAQDVAYLLALKDVLDEHLAALDRAAWLEEECERLVQQSWDIDDAAGLRKLRQAWRLPPAGQEALHRLWLWRERRARELDRPRQRVLRDGPLQQIARELPDSNGGLAGLDLPPGWIRRFGDDVLGIMAEVRALPEEELTTIFAPPPRDESAQKLKQLKNIVSQVAEKMNLPASFLVNRQTLETLAQDPSAAERWPPELNGWRDQAIGRQLRSALESPADAGQEG